MGLTIAKASKRGIVISGNSGPMDCMKADHFLAMGAKTVQFGTIVMKYGYRMINDLNWGLSHLLEARGFKSVSGFIGCARPNIIIPFTEISSKKKIPDVDEKLCLHCGNCTRCKYLTAQLDKKGISDFDLSLCIDCSIRVQKCFPGTLK